MNRKDLQLSTKRFHVDIIRLCGDFPRNAAGFETVKRLIRAAGSVGADYRVTVRANQMQILFIRSKSFWKRRTKVITDLK